jgi:SAM-dependent methyltransferase
VAVMLNSLGIEYRAPYGDLLKTRPGQYEIVTCTQVLQHIPKPVQLAIFQELHACLKPGGLFHATVHFVGQFRSPILQEGQYEHLRYAPEIWEKWINSSLMSFNRLKGPDYQETLAQAGFRLREFKLTAPTEADLAELKRTQVHPCFSRYSEQDLAARGVFFVAEKP